ncbi:uncharacterized protein LOC124807306 [Hydra vulgaris]|uniref:uncharacterized protein LOC124807306 n=1 Tax=Hydra vulgaris TaxID=6087 RepID=UPI001F5EC083|nr:uncharacterized protein LOC124807306 [Hydra vulgaris]
MGSIFQPLLIVTMTTILAIALACLIVGAVGNFWWKDDNNKEIGLLSTSTGSDINYRTNVLKFNAQDDQVSVKKDIILILIIIGGAFALLSIWNALFLFCCFKNRSHWLWGSSILIVTTFMAGAWSLAAIIYAEVEFKFVWEKSEHGYAAVLTWVGSGTCVVAFIISFFSICITPTNEYLTHAHNQGSYFTYDREKGLQMDNIGYDGSH